MSSLVESWSGSPVISVKEKANYKDFNFEKYLNYPNLVGHYRLSHIRGNSSLRDLFVKRNVIVMIRDPRDICNSMLHYLLKSTNRMHQVASKQLIGLSYDEQIMLIAEGISDSNDVAITPSLEKWCSGFIELQEEVSDAFVLRYEDFFEINSISKFLSQIFTINEIKARSLVESALLSGSKTKREGGAKPVQWRSVYSENLKEYFEVNHGAIIERLGYKI